MARIPEPMPDRENQGHYKDVLANKISVNNKKEIEEFSTIQYAVQEGHVTAYVQHGRVEACAPIRAREKQQRRNAKKQKSFVDYDWKELQ